MSNQLRRCRNCKHVESIHQTDDGGSYCRRGWLVDYPDGDHLPHCYCPGYEPLDNLEYLELKYEQQIQKPL
jgi:hypothetical protein